MTGLFSPNWKESIVPIDCTIFDILTSLSRSGSLMACFVDETGKLLGILTDSDIRKALIAGYKMEDKAFPIANSKPKTADHRANAASLIELSALSKVQEIPLVDESGALCDLFVVSIRERRVQTKTPSNFEPRGPIPNAMFIVAGGLGSRLSPILRDRPKPLAPVGPQPILATIIEQGVLAGIRNFYVSVNHMADQIKAFLASEEYKTLKITVIHEPYRTGTAWSLALIPDKIQEPLLICNADILTTARFDRIIAQHLREQASLTCAIRPHRVPVPFGVFRVENGLIQDIKEKPEEAFLVNAAIYVMNPELIELIPHGSSCDMPDLIQKALDKGLKVSPFYLHEYWIDIGMPDDYERAKLEFNSHFANFSSPALESE